MKTAISLLMIAIPFLYYPIYPAEEFEGPKAAALIGFSCLSLFIVKWKHLRNDKIALSFFFFVLSAIISTIWSIDRHISIFGNPKLNNGLLTYVSCLILYLLTTQSFKEDKDKLFLVRIILGASAVVAGYGISQALGYDFRQWNDALYLYGYMRPISSLGHPNFMAAYLAMVIPFAIWRFHTTTYKIEKIASFLTSILVLIAIFLSQSRGMWWATISGLFVYFYIAKISLKRFISIISIVLVIAASTLVISKPFRHGTFDRIVLVTNLGKDRLEYLKGAVRIWRKYPIVGSGVDTFELAFQHARSKRYWEIQAGGSPHRAHNEFFNVLATQGLLGVITGALFLFTIYRAIKGSSSIFLAPVAASIMAFFVQEISSFHVVATTTLLMVCLSLISQYRPYRS